MPRVDFHYIKTGTGELSGQSFVDQTEQAINELGVFGEDVETTANSALSQAQTAQQTANAAQQTANSAVSQAQSAQSSADAAQQAAEQAQTTADNALEAAQNAGDAAGTKAPIMHASDATTYGVGSSTLYGHVQLSDSTHGAETAASGGTAATPYAVAQVMTAAQTAQTAANSAQQTANQAQSTANQAQSTANSAQQTATQTQTALNQAVENFTQQITALTQMQDFVVTDTAIDVESYAGSFSKLYLTSSASASTGLPSGISYPCFFWTERTADGNTAMMYVLSDNLLYSQSGVNTTSDGDTETWTFTGWQQITYTAATTSALGVVKPDGTTVEVATDGTLSINTDLLSTVYKFKGSVATVDDLPTDATQGDVYNVTATDANYAWTGSAWDNIGGIEAVDSSPVQGSTNPVASGGVYTALENLQTELEGQITASAATPDGVTIANNSANKLMAQDVAIGGDASDLASTRGLFRFFISNDPTPDLNNFVTQGIYFFYSSSSSAGANFPFKTGGLLYVYSSTNQYIKQIYTGATTARTAERQGSNAGWSSWSDLLRSSGVGDGITVNAGIISVPEYEGATESAAATSGLVPPATSAQSNLYLSGDGEWTDPRPSAGNGISIVDNTVSVKPKTTGGLSVDSSGVSVSVGDGISISDAGAIIAKLQQDGGLAIKSDTGEIFVDFSLLPADMLTDIVISMIQEGGGLSVDDNGQLYVDFSSMPTDKFDAMLKSIRVPIWLSAPLTIYVDITGSDTLDEGRGETEDKPFATLQAALNYVADTYNLSRYNITIKLGAGDYGRTSITLPSYTASTGEIYIRGASPSEPESTKIGRVNLRYSNNYHLIDLTCKPADINVATAGVAPSAGFIYLQNTVIDISETTVSNNANLMGISTSLTGTAYINATDGDVPNGVKIKVADTFSSPNIILSSAGGNILAYADVEVEGTATLGSCFASARQLGKIQFLKAASPNPGRTAIVKLADGASITGKRYAADLNGIIDTNGGGPEFFPGTIDGTISNGGQYA